MHSNNKVIKKLVAIGKKHKFLTYPMLVLIAIVSMCLNLKTWARGSGRRTVALILACALVISQSYFMTSSANQTEFVEEEEVEETIELGPLNSSVDDTKEKSEDTEAPATEAALVSTEAPAVTEAEVSDMVTPVESIDVPDAEDLRNDISEPVAEESEELEIEKLTSPADDEDDEDVDLDVFSDPVGAADILDCELATAEDVAKFGSASGYIVQTGTANTTIKNFLPKKLKCTIKQKDGQQFTDYLAVQWKTDGAFSYTNGSVVLYMPEFTDGNKYDQQPADDDLVRIKIIFRNKYQIVFDGLLGGSVNANNFISESGNYYGYSDENYTIPGVTRAKADGSGNFTLLGWMYDGNMYEAGDPFNKSPEDNSVLTLTAVYKEAEVKYTDSMNPDTVIYKYPTKGTSYLVDATPDGVKGYAFTGWKNGAKTGLKAGDEVSASIEDTELEAVWAARTYNISYDANFTGGSVVKKQHTYSPSGDAFDTASSLGFSRTGYAFKGWSISKTSDTVTYEDGEELTKDILDSKFDTGSTVDLDPQDLFELYAIWEKCDITFEDGNTTAAFSKATVYGTGFTETFTLSGDNSSGNFNVQLKSMSVDGGDVNKDDYINGLAVSTTGSTLTISGTPVSIWSGDATLTIAVADAAVPDTTYDLTVTLSVEKKTLTIKSISGFDKVYDGKNTLADDALDTAVIELEGIYADDAGKVSVDTTTLGAKYDSKDVGDRSVIFNSVSLAGEKRNNYTIEDEATFENGAKITKRPLFIKVDGTVKQYLGEENITQDSFDFPPEIDMDNDGWTPAEAAATATIVNNDGGLDNVVTLTYIIPEIQEGESYDVPITPLSDNYAVSCPNANVKMEVLQEKAILYTGAEPEKENFEAVLVEGVDENGQATGWSTDVVTLKPRIAHDDHYYDKILLKGKGNWSDSYVIDDDSELNDKDFQVLVKNSVSGAYTSESDVLHYKVDTKAPTFEDSEFSSNSSNLLTSIGNFFTYGNFFQETVNAKLTFKDNKSGLNKIFFDLKGGDDWSEKPLPEDGVFSVDIPLGTNNEIAFYVTDKAGNKSEVIKLLGNADGSQWVIERNAPALMGTHVENLDGDRISNLTSGNWYNQPVQVVADVSESESGIQYADWYVNGASERITENEWKKSSETGTVALKYPITKSGVFEVSIDVTDNANNKMGMKELNNIRIDLEAPTITVNDEDLQGGFATSKDIPFKAEDLVSGIYKVTVVPPLGTAIEATKISEGNYSFTAGMSGEYTIYARDEAGNESSKAVTIDNISTEVPTNASVIWTPDTPTGSNGWYSTFPVATIIPATQKGSTPVTTYYRLWTGAEPDTQVGIKEATDVKITSDGIWNLRVWTQTDAGVRSDAEYYDKVYVDTTKPDAGVSKVVAETTSQTVTFIMTDNMSGIDTGRITVTNGSQAVESTITANGDGTGYTGSFVVSNPGEYVVSVYDVAGNVSTQATYKPMTMKVNTIKSITESSAVISNNVYRGTYAISSLKYEYKKASDKNYNEITPYAVKDADGNMTGSYTFSSLEPNTKYNYRITAVSAAGEVLTYTGNFKTAGATGITVSGVAIDADDSSSDITVSLLSGNTVLETTDIKSGAKFSFANVPDGNYNISATNGHTSRTISINVNNKKVIDPKGDILITLRNGMTTSVNLVGSKTPNVSVSGLEDIFSHDTVNFTDNDRKFIEEGGTVEFKLNVAYRASSAVPQNDLAAVYNVMEKNEKVNMFIDLDLYKIRYYASGAVESKTQVHELSGNVSIKVVLPLPSKVAKANDKSVFRVHNNAASQLADLDASASSYTIKSSQFSTYALVYATNSKETEDTTEKKTTEAKKTESTTEKAKSDDDSKKKSEVADNSGGTKRGGGTTILNYDASPKTGDEAPVAPIAITMIISMIGILLLKKKQKD